MDLGSVNLMYIPHWKDNLVELLLDFCTRRMACACLFFRFDIFN